MALWTSQHRPVWRANPELTHPWHALWAMMIGFFMILVDSTIVAVANPSIMNRLQTDYNGVIWVTSAYLLAYAVPLLVAGRLGDQFGPKNLYLVGLFIFTAASLWCGLSGSVEMLVAARLLQGVGAALLTPQTLSTITRIFPRERRGAAMSVWGATAGVATLVGPLAGGVLVDHLGWRWIFFVNVPIGVIGLVLAYWLVPVLGTHRHRFDVLGVLLSGAAMFLVVFGLQEGESRQWPLWIWGMIAAGVVTMTVFVFWQAVNKHEPLIPLRVFRDRDFSLSTMGIAVIGFAVTAMIVPVMFYAQAVCGLTPTRSALLTAPMAVMSGSLAPLVGRIVDRSHPRPVIGFGFAVLAIALTWLSGEMTPTTPIWRLALPFLALGVGMAFIFSPLAATATRNLAPELAGAGSGVYNATRQVGSVLGSAGIGAFMTSRIGAEMPGGQSRSPAEAATGQLPELLREPFAAALSQSMLLPAFIALFGVIAALFMVGFVKPAVATPAPVGGRSAPAASTVPAEEPADGTARARPAAHAEAMPLLSDTLGEGPIVREFASQPDFFKHIDYPSDVLWRPGGYPEGYVDDGEDSYVEYLITAASGDVGHPLPLAGERAEPVAHNQLDEHVEPDDDDTEPLPIRVELPQNAPVESWHSDPVESWRRLSHDAPIEETSRQRVGESIGFVGNNFHGDQRRSPSLPPPSTTTAAAVGTDLDRRTDRIDGFLAGPPDLADTRSPRHGSPDHDHAQMHTGRQYRGHPGDTSSRGRHSLPQHDADV
jgi:EmrB/QacA subfamily drug resistance transporter